MLSKKKGKGPVLKNNSEKQFSEITIIFGQKRFFRKKSPILGEFYRKFWKKITEVNFLGAIFADWAIRRF